MRLRDSVGKFSATRIGRMKNDPTVNYKFRLNVSGYRWNEDDAMWSEMDWVTSWIVELNYHHDGTLVFCNNTFLVYWSRQNIARRTGFSLIYTSCLNALHHANNNTHMDLITLYLYYIIHYIILITFYYIRRRKPSMYFVKFAHISEEFKIYSRVMYVSKYI